MFCVGNGWENEGELMFKKRKYFKEKLEYGDRNQIGEKNSFAGEENVSEVREVDQNLM